MNIPLLKDSLDESEKKELFELLSIELFGHKIEKLTTVKEFCLKHKGKMSMKLQKVLCDHFMCDYIEKIDASKIHTLLYVSTKTQ